MAIAPTTLSLEEFLALPEETPALEYLDGVVRQKVSPRARHGRLQYRLAERINAVAEPAQIALAQPEVRVSFAGKSYVPDISVFRWSRIPLDAAGDLVDDVRQPPDIAIEIISPGQSARKVTERCREYVAGGVEVALLIDPKRRTVTAFRPDAITTEWRGSDPIDISAVVLGFHLTVDELFESLHISRSSDH